jgi:putative oxidoreductase
MFPPGLPGLALLFLRASVAVALLAEFYSHQRDLSGWIQAAAILVSLALSLGYLTPIAAVMCLVLHTLIWSGLGFGNAAVATTIGLDVIALALLGPGAYSVDYYRFGRRQVILPPR